MQIRIVACFSMLAAAFLFLVPAHAQSRVVVIGDSNTAGYGVGAGNAFPAILESTLRAFGYNVSVSNQGISGDTTRGMLSRLASAVPGGTRVAIVQGGYNDGRRGAPPEAVAANVDAILAELSARRVKVILCGLSGASWGGIARRRGALLVPGETCYDPTNRSFDGLHVNAQGHRVVAARLAPIVRRYLARG